MEQKKKIGRPALSKGQKKTRPSLSISPEIMAELKDASEKTKLSRSALVDACCRQRLPGLVEALMVDRALSVVESGSIIEDLKRKSWDSSRA